MLSLPRQAIQFNGSMSQLQIIKRVQYLKQQVRSSRTTPTLAVVQTLATHDSMSYLQGIKKVLK